MWSLSLTCLYGFSRSPCALSFCSTIALSLCPGVFGRYSSFPLILQPLQWLHGLATQLGAHYLLIHRREDRQRQPAPFLCWALSAPIILSLSLSLSLSPPPSTLPVKMSPLHFLPSLAPFVFRALSSPPFFSLSLSLSLSLPPQHFLSKKGATALPPLSRSSHHTLHYSTSSPRCIMSQRVLRGINSSISIY